MTAYGQTTQLFSTPYLTAAEFKNAPTSVDCDNLVPGGNATQNDAELTNLIARASSWVDSHCRQVLAATVDTYQTTGRVGRDGMLRLHTRYGPIRSVSALAFGASPDALSTVALDSTVWVEDNRIIVPAALVGVASIGTFPRPATLGRRVLCRVTYVNGYPNTTLTAAASGATLAVKDATGILPGDALNVYDETNGPQTVIVAGTWTPTTGAQNVPVTTAVTAAAGVSVSGLPPAVKQACIHVVTAMLKGRGSGAIQMRSATEPGGTASSGAESDYDRAKDLLTDFRRVV